MVQPTIRNGSRGDTVKLWQRILGPPIVDDGIFGPKTLAATKVWQGERGLVADGIVGPKTWGAADAEKTLEGIYKSVARTEAISNEGSTLKSEFLVWYDNLNPLQRIQDSTRKEAVNRKNAFDIANVRTQSQLTAVKQTKATEPSQEEIRKSSGGTDDAGNYPEEEGTTVASASKTLVGTSSRPTLRRGSSGEAVKVWQRILGSPIAVDGKFGPITESATKVWQRERDLTADGIVGPATWTAALAKTPPVEVPFSTAATTKVASTKKKPKDVPSGVVIPMTVVAKAPTKKAKEKAKPVSQEESKKAAEPSSVDKEIMGISREQVNKYRAGIAGGLGLVSWGLLKLIF